MNLAGNPFALFMLMLALALSIFAVHADAGCACGGSPLCLALRGRGVRLHRQTRRPCALDAVLAALVACVPRWSLSPLAQSQTTEGSLAPLRI